MPSINLLPWRQELRKRREKEFLIGLGAAVLLAGVIAAIAHFSVNSMIESQQRRNALLESEITELDKAIAEIVELRDQKRRMLSRMEVIEKLQRSRPEVVHVFDQVVRTLPDGVYLTSIKQNDRKLEINGVAQSSTRVSALMRNIDASDTLSEPQLKVIQTRRDNAIGADFTLFATVKSAALPEDEADAGGKPKRVREAQR